MTGLTVGGITVCNGTKGALSGSGTTYTLPVTPTAAGAVTCQVNAAVASDAATNANIVSNTASVTFTVTSPFDSWASVLPEGQRGASQTPQNDGVTNLEKFAFNLNMLAPDVRRLTVGANQTEGLPGALVVGGVLRLEFLRRRADANPNPGITYTAQFGSDLTGWTDIAVGTPAGVAINGTWERVTVNDPTGGAKRFGRVKVVQTP